jgi:hypothetical protein
MSESNLTPQQVEILGMRYALAAIESTMLYRNIEVLPSGADNAGLQRWFGDIAAFLDPRGMDSWEVKSENAEKYGNFFCEIWSNRTFTDFRRGGWMTTCHSAGLIYVFCNIRTAYLMHFPTLFNWFWGVGEGMAPSGATAGPRRTRGRARKSRRRTSRKTRPSACRYPSTSWAGRSAGGCTRTTRSPEACGSRKNAAATCSRGSPSSGEPLNLPITTMTSSKRRRLESAGFRVGTAAEFLGLTVTESRRVEEELRRSLPLSLPSPPGQVPCDPTPNSP